MVKTEPNITVDAETWQKFKTAVDNASREIEQFMRQRTSRGVESVEDAEQQLQSLESELEALQSEKAALRMEKEDLESEDGIGEGWICYDCSETGPGDAGEIDRCPGCHGERVHQQEQDDGGES